MIEEDQSLMRKARMTVKILWISPLIGTNLYIANLSKRVREKDLEAKFSKFGTIKQCMVVRDPITRYKLTTSNSNNYFS
jgi:RNA recognition motif-containing protein